MNCCVEGEGSVLREAVPTSDVVIIGGGPAGATAALYAARAALDTVVVDRGLTSGALGAAGKITNYPGVREALSGAELVERMRAQAEDVGARFARDKVITVDLAGETPSVRGASVHTGRALIVASGALGRTDGLPGEERLLGRGVSYCATCDGFFFAGREVAVIGDSDEAVEEALLLTRHATRVHLITPRDALRSSEPLRREAESNPRIHLRSGRRVREILGEASVEGLRLSTEGQTEDLAVDGVFIYAQGHRPITEFLGGQVALDESGCIRVDEFLQTSARGVFAAGDVLCKHLKQVVVAAAEGALAAMSVERFLAGRACLRPDWA